MREGVLKKELIKKDSPIPYYFQLEEILREAIEGGKWVPDQQIPSEPELCEMLGVSRTVVRQALNELVNEGLLYRRRGKGTFVTRSKIAESLVQNLTGFYEDMVAKGLVPITQVLEQKLIPASKKVAGMLNLREGDQVIKIDRLRSVGNEPILIVTTFIPHQICPGLLEEDLTNQSLYAVIEGRYNLEIARGRRTLEAISASEEEAKLLGIEEGDPLILLKSVSYLEDGGPIEYFEAKHRGDRSRFEVELIRRRRPRGPIEEILPPELPPSNIVVE
ncbi:MAG: GntR family transcriptional regulator [Anaerolineae bacterium]